MPGLFDPPLEHDNDRPSPPQPIADYALAWALCRVFEALARRPGDGDVEQTVTDPTTGRVWRFALHRGE